MSDRQVPASGFRQAAGGRNAGSIGRDVKLSVGAGKGRSAFAPIRDASMPLRGTSSDDAWHVPWWCGIALSASPSLCTAPLHSMVTGPGISRAWIVAVITSDDAIQKRNSRRIRFTAPV